MLCGFLSAAEQHPELGTHVLVNPSVTAGETTENGVTSVLRLDFSSAQKAFTYEELCENRKEAERFAEDVIPSVIKDASDDLAKAGAIHDYLALHVTYDYTFSPQAYTAYGALLEGKAVCQGYSGAFNLLCKAAGIEAFAVANRTHMWNAVKTDGKIYYYDVTFDDTGDVLTDTYKGLSAYSPDESYF